MLKRILSVILSAIVLASGFVRVQALEVSASGAVLMCAETGEVLFSVNSEKRLSMASTTKIMTALIALEAEMPSLEITVTPEMAEVEGTSMGLMAGDSVSLEELVYGMLLQSGNDAANTAAIVLGGSVEKFSELMNRRAAEIGMKNTHFVTPSGLDDDEHYSTAYDMALLACECLRDPRFVKIASSKTARLSYGSPPYDRTLTNHNRLLWSLDDCVGIKTGFTKKSGRCLVSAVRRGGITLVAVTLNAPDDWNDHRAMYEYGFSVISASPRSIESFSLPVCGGVKRNAEIRAAYDPVFPDNADIRRTVYLPRFEYAPIKKGEVFGSVSYFANGRMIASVPLAASEDVTVSATERKPEKNFFEKLCKKIGMLFRRSGGE